MERASRGGAGAGRADDRSQPMTVRARIVAQFRQPHGPLGRLAGAIMAHRPSNRARNSWTVRLLDLHPEDHVLEFGCGPGVALEACLAAMPAGRAVGIDHSPVMIGQAARRLRAGLADGRLSLQAGGLELLDGYNGAFDRVFSVNVVQFLPDLDATFAKIRAALKPGGRAATSYMPRTRNPSREDALRMAGRISRAMAAAGLVDLRTEELPLTPVPAICVLGRRAD
ncbi:MAG: class I SAM-dependent methyltransferase [Rhodospirillales bacterium]|nr:MAG: class I SAM-dependent methyltransferase [Rhodospirillales bacterium]